jgi:flagellar protein FliO/FliZ
MFFAGLFIINILDLSAQETPGGEAAAQVTPNPRIAAEQAMVWEDGGAETGASAAPSSIGTVLRMVLTLALAAAAIYGIIYFIKRAGRRVEIRDPFLKILASAHLGNNRYAHIVAVGSKAWLLGAAEGGVNLISEIDDKDVLNAMLLEDSRKSADSATGNAGRLLDFKAMLRRLGMSIDSGTPGADNIRKRRERLKGLK